MNLAELTAAANEVHRIYLAHHAFRVDGDWYLLKLTEELGELVQQTLRSRHGTVAGGPQLADEVADLFGHLLLFASRHEIDLEDAFRKKWMRFLPESRP